MYQISIKPRNTYDHWRELLELPNCYHIPWNHEPGGIGSPEDISYLSGLSDGTTISVKGWSGKVCVRVHLVELALSPDVQSNRVYVEVDQGLTVGDVSPMVRSLNELYDLDIQIINSQQTF